MYSKKKKSFKGSKQNDLDCTTFGLKVWVTVATFRGCNEAITADLITYLRSIL